MDSGVFNCHKCHMIFGTPSLLQKHKLKFCVGGTLGDPDELLLRKERRPMNDSPRSVSPVDKHLSGDDVLHLKVGQLNALKTRRGKLRDIRDLEERMLLDELEDTERKSAFRGRSIEPLNHRIPLSKYPEVRNLQIEYHHLRDREVKSVIPLATDRSQRVPPLHLATDRSLRVPPIHLATDRSSHHVNPSRMSSVSIHLPEDNDYPHNNPNQEAQLRQLAENHGRQMEYLQLRNRDLEKQRNDIRHRLDELGRKSHTNDHTTQLLQELKDQEARNQRALEDLRQQLWGMSHNRVNVIDLDHLSGNIKHSLALIEQIEDEISKIEEKGNRKSTSTSIKSSMKSSFGSETKVNKQRLSNVSQQSEPTRPSVTAFTSAANSSCSLHSESEMSIHLNCTPSPSLTRSIGDRQTCKPLGDEDSFLKERCLTNSADNYGNYKFLELYKKHEVPKRVSKFGTVELGKYKNFQNCDLSRTSKLALNNVQMNGDLLRRLGNVIGLMAQQCDRLANQPPSHSQWRRVLNMYPYSEVERPTQLPKPDPHPKETARKSFVYPVYYGNSFVAEISAIRQAYLQNGGNDTEIISQMSQLLAEAQAMEEQMKNQQLPEKRHRDKKSDISTQFQSLEFENERLQRELLLLQEQKFLANERRKTDKEDLLENEFRRLQRDYLRRMAELQRELEFMRQEAQLARLNRDIPVAAHPQPPQRPYVEVEPMAPYDQYAGFMVFYDFVLNVDSDVSACRLIVGLHSTSAVVGEAIHLPTIYTEPATRSSHSKGLNSAVVGAKQPVPKCPPQPEIGIVVELQVTGGPASEHDRNTLITRAWTKIPLFDNNGRLIAGRFRIPLRNVPIKPYLHTSQLPAVPRYGEAELYYRLVNMRDSEVQSMANIAASNHELYATPRVSEPPNVMLYTPHRHMTPPVTPQELDLRRSPVTPRELDLRSTPQDQKSHRRPPAQPTRLLPQDRTIGFQVERVKNAEGGEGKVRLTAYYASTGKVVQSSTSPVTCSTTPVRSNFRFKYHMFGQQEATFHDVELKGDIVLIARFYLQKRQQDTTDDVAVPNVRVPDNSLQEEETLTAWAALPLVVCSDRDVSMRGRRSFDASTMHINAGTHTMKLYQPPVPEASWIPFDVTVPYSREWTPYNKASLRIHIFQGQPRPGSLTPNDLSSDEEAMPEFAWLPYERKIPPKHPFIIGDGFDVYIDGCRYLPDSVTYTKVAGRILSRKNKAFGRDINTSVKLGSDIFNPVYEDKTEYRESSMMPTATLFMKVYTVDSFQKSLTVVGYAVLNIFVQLGTNSQPSEDQPGIDFALNEGAHQLRLYCQGPRDNSPITASCLADAGIRIIPCASLLVRLTRVPRGPTGKALEASKVPQADWLRLGLWQPRPKYTDRIYLSTLCMPKRGESTMFHAMMKRSPITIRESVAKMTQAKDSFLRSDKNIEEYIRNKLTKHPEVTPLSQDMNYICQYSPKHGLKISVESAVNLPWLNFTLAHMCLNPPGAFYSGAPFAAYDNVVFTELLDLRSTNSSPTWRDGFKHFPRRCYHRYLTAIIHLQEVSVTASKQHYKYGLLEQAWTAIPIFTEKYAYTSAFQLPLFHGAPTQQMLKQLVREPCREWLERNIRNNNIRLLEASSVFVKIADARRDDELNSDIYNNKMVEWNTDYIPAGMEAEYLKERPGRPLEAIVPQGKTPEQFVDALAVKFKSLVFKVYEEDNLAK